MADLYELLGVERDATQEEIKKAWKHLAQKLHSDKQGGDEAQFKRVKEAYRVLKNPSKRAEYDKTGEIPHAINPLEIKARDHLVILFGQALNQGTGKLARLDILGAMDKELVNAIQKTEINSIDAKQKRRELQDIKDKFHVDDGRDNVFVAVIENELTRIETYLEDNSQQLTMMKLARELLSHHSYDFQRALPSGGFPSATLGTGFSTYTVQFP